MEQGVLLNLSTMPSDFRLYGVVCILSISSNSHISANKRLSNCHPRSELI